MLGVPVEQQSVGREDDGVEPVGRTVVENLEQILAKQRLPAGHEHFPDLVACADVREHRREMLFQRTLRQAAQRVLACTMPAGHRAVRRGHNQGAIGKAVNKSRDRRAAALG